MLEKLGRMDRAIPLMVHGDGVPVTRVGQSGAKSLDTISWQSLFAAGSGVRNVKHLLFTIFEDNKAVPRAGDESNTMHDVWEIIAWTFERPQRRGIYRKWGAYTRQRPQRRGIYRNR